MRPRERVLLILMESEERDLPAAGPRERGRARPASSSSWKRMRSTAAAVSAFSVDIRGKGVCLDVRAVQTDDMMRRNRSSLDYNVGSKGIYITAVKAIDL